jgi:UDPglucose 6-dehydrogenase
MKLAIIGTGYVGLVTGTCFAETGNEVVCVDIDRAKVDGLNAGKIPIYEPGLEQLFERNKQLGRLHFTTNLKDGVDGAEVIFLALPTPEGESGSADLQYILKVAKDLGPLLTGYVVIVDKSTAPVGTSEKVAMHIRATASVDFDVVVNPEFLREGIAVDDFMKPDRIVVGTGSTKARKIMKTLYAPFIGKSSSLIFMDERSAELTKYAANAYLATRISFMNEIANLSELLGCNADNVRKGLGTDSRIGNKFLYPGIGYGGSCFPKDVKALSAIAHEAGYDFKILTATTSVNGMQRVRLVQMIRNHFGNIRGRTLAVWGLSFKPHTDDIREAPALHHIKALLDEGAVVRVHDPEALGNTFKIFGNRVQYFEEQYEAVAQADALVVMTEWPQFLKPDFELLRSSLKNKVIFDGRNLYDTNLMRDLGFTYYSIGRKVIFDNNNTVYLDLNHNVIESKKVASL